MPEEKTTLVAKTKDNAPKGTTELEKALSDFNAENAPAVQQTAQKKAVRKRSSAKRKAVRNVTVTRGKRKEAIARARITPGSGEVVINGISVDLLKPKEIRELILEPLRISEEARGLMRNSRISVDVRGGGISGRAQAARSAIAKTLVAASGSEALKRQYLAYDRNLIVDDNRRVEPKKFLGPKARARNQTSYR
ncbi:MAG: 30S ribosomal protein S9 [Candidatus Marsarchaeota archaeon]|nr:30S ribosomal protein S9 [Candidatus Marsarchaeota archaeon]